MDIIQRSARSFLVALLVGLVAVVAVVAVVGVVQVREDGESTSHTGIRRRLHFFNKGGLHALNWFPFRRQRPAVGR